MQKRIFNVDKNTEKKDLLAEILVCTLLTAGIAGLLCAFAKSVVCGIFIIIEAVVLSTVIAILRKKPFAAQFFQVALVIVFILIALFGFRGMQSAMLTGVNNMIDHINTAMDKELTLFGSNGAKTWQLICFFSMLTALAAMLVSYLVHKRAVVAISIVALALIFATVVLKAPAALIIVGLMFIGWIGCWGLCTAGGGKNLLLVCGGAAAAFAVGAIIFGFSGFQGFKSIDDFHDDASDKLYTMRYGDDSLPHGDMTAASEMNSSESPTLTVSFEKPEVLYLKGFTGTTFSENEWEEHESESYTGEWNGMLEYFKENDFDPLKMYAKYSELNDDDTEYNKITVENVGADRSFDYLPFTAASTEGRQGKDYLDLYTKSSGIFGTKKYTFTNVVTDTKPELMNTLSQSWGKKSDERENYMKSENAYRAFVQDTYLDMDEKTREEINEVFFKDFGDDKEELGVYAITSRIRSILSLVTEYEEKPERPDDKDFIGWFLGEYRKGNSAYYATTAVMAYRAAGIPARYAEGYFVSETDVQNLNETKMKKIQLTDKNAHSWVEIYRDGIGWVSIEVTPGFYVEDTSMSEIIDISKNMDSVGSLNGHGSEHYTSSLSMYSPEKADDSDRMSSLARFLFILLLLASLFVLAMYIRFMLLTYKKYKIMYGPTNPETTSRMLEYICAALNADGIKANPDNPNGFRQALLDKYKSFSAPQFDRVITLLRRSSYGGAKLKEHELRTIRIFMNRLFDSVYENKNILQKTILKCVKIV